MELIGLRRYSALGKVSQLIYVNIFVFGNIGSYMRESACKMQLCLIGIFHKNVSGKISLFSPQRLEVMIFSDFRHREA